MNTSSQPPPERHRTESCRKRTVWQVAPNVPKQPRTIQFGIGTLLVIVSLGGPLLAAAMTVPHEFYQLNAQLAAGVAVFCGISFAISFCRPYWALAIMVIAILFGAGAHLAIATNRFHLGEAGSLKLLVIAWATMISAGSGFLLSYARHDH